MTKATDPTLTGESPAELDEEPATLAETRAHLLARSNRDFAPISKEFVQNPDRNLADRAAVLAVFVRNGDLRALRAFLFLHAIISSDKGDNGWSTTLPLAVWARVYDTPTTADLRSASTAATKILTRLEQKALIRRARTGRARSVTVTLLRPDGSGHEYVRPDGDSDRYLKLDNRYWTDGWYERLDLPATAMLLVALHAKPGFELATERMRDWYGFSPDTAERGFRTLQNLGIIEVHKRLKKAPLSPTGATEVNVYTLLPPFQVDAAQAPKAPEESASPVPRRRTAPKSRTTRAGAKTSRSAPSKEPRAGGESS